MKTNKWFKALPALAFAAAVALSSCARENGENPGNIPAPEGYGYLAITPTTNATDLTRGYDGTNQGTAAENFVTKIYVLLYNTDATGLLKYRLEYTVDNTNGAALKNFTGNIASVQTSVTDKTVGVITEGRVVELQAYKMIVVCNPSAAITSATVAGTSKLSDFESAKTETVANLIGTDRFVMTNADGVVNVTTAQLKDTKLAAEASPVSVLVERTVAKVSVKKGVDYDANISKNTTGGTKIYESITVPTWYLDVTNSSTFWKRVQATPRTGGSETAGALPIVRKDYYAIDPNYTTAENASATFGVLDLTSGTNLSDAKNAWDASVYAIENTMETAEQTKWLDVATQVVVKCQIVPLGFTLGDSYYSEGTAVFTHAQALVWAQSTDPATDIPPIIVTRSTAATAAAFQTILKDSDFFLDVLNDPIAAAPTTFTSSNGITFHLNGWNVYRVPIKHFTDNSETEASYGFYGVVRNNAYTVNITDITGPGNGTSDKFISAFITINPWLLRSQDEVLGN